MWSQHIVIQKINEDGKLNFYHGYESRGLVWSFENRRTFINSDNPEIFPFQLDNHVRLSERSPGAETKLIYRPNQEITFYDDYGVPSGFVIAILFPKNYVPIIFKFKEKPYIPVGIRGNVVTKPPGYFNVHYNRVAKMSAIVFLTTENIAFGFKCVARKVDSDKFPQKERVLVDDAFEVSIDTSMLNSEMIRPEDLKCFSEVIARNATLDDLQISLNELIEALNEEKSDDRTNKVKRIKRKMQSQIVNSTGVSGSLVTILDSYHNGGVAKEFIAKVMSYFLN